MVNELPWHIEDLENQTLVALTIAQNAFRKAEICSRVIEQRNIGAITVAILEELLIHGSAMLEEKMIGALMIAKKAISRAEDIQFQSGSGCGLSCLSDIGPIAGVIFKKLVSR